MELSWKLGGCVLSLPDPPRYRMGRAPLAQAIAQVSFPVVARMELLSGVAPLQDALADLFPYMNRNRMQQVSLTVGPAGPATSETTESWVNEFTDDEGWTLSVTATSASLTIGSDYTTLIDFAERFEKVCTALRDAARISRCDRIGLRYMNLVSTDRAGWASWFQPKIIGLADPALTPPDHLVATVTETRLRRPPEGVFAWAVDSQIEGIVRYGVVPAGSVIAGVPPRSLKGSSLVLDLDMYLAAPQKFTPESLVEQFHVLHTDIERMFFWAVTDEGKSEFDLQVEDSGGA